MSSEAAGRGGALFVVSAPSGAGKTTLVRMLCELDEEVVASVSHTTRPRRRGEREGVDYHFVAPSHFQRLIDTGAFLEHARVFGHHYGTSRDGVQRTLAAGRDVVLEIDWQGARQVRQRRPDAIGVFVMPPSHESLHARLRARGEDDEAVIARRMRDAASELSHYREFDYLIVNDTMERAAGELRCIVHAQRLQRRRQACRHRLLLERLCEDVRDPLATSVADPHHPRGIPHPDPREAPPPVDPAAGKAPTGAPGRLDRS